MNDINGIKKIATNYINNVRNTGISVDEAYLFGSYAKGKYSKFSDIDVCIVSPKFGKDYIEDSLILKKIANKIDYRIEPVPLTPDDLRNKYSTLASEIATSGINLT
jgi:predicted nucleotidyltransferase